MPVWSKNMTFDSVCNRSQINNVGKMGKYSITWASFWELSILNNMLSIASRYCNLFSRTVSIRFFCFSLYNACGFCFFARYSFVAIVNLNTFKRSGGVLFRLLSQWKIAYFDMVISRSSICDLRDSDVSIMDKMPLSVSVISTCCFWATVAALANLSIYIRKSQ